jgi:hypothetical protein
MDTLINVIKLFLDCINTHKKRKPKNDTFLLFFDLKSAFDFVDHEILFKKLEKFNFD